VPAFDTSYLRRSPLVRRWSPAINLPVAWCRVHESALCPDVVAFVAGGGTAAMLPPEFGAPVCLAFAVATRGVHGTVWLDAETFRTVRECWTTLS
jgi:hypothetical protein